MMGPGMKLYSPAIPFMVINGIVAISMTSYSPDIKFINNIDGDRDNSDTM